MSAGQNALDFSTDALAVKRLTRLVTDDEITEPLRQIVWRRFGGPEGGRGLGYGITCPHCVSIWVSVFVAAARIMVPKAWSPISTGLALAGVTSLIAERE